MTTLHGACVAPPGRDGGAVKRRNACAARDLWGQTWDNGDHNKAAPGGASTPLIQGPRRLARSRLMVSLPPSAATTAPPTPNEPAPLSECMAELLAVLREREGR